LLRLHCAGVELAESVFSSGDTDTLTPYKPRFVMNGGATKRPAQFLFLLDPPYVWINEGAQTIIPHLSRGKSAQTGLKTCTRESRTALFTDPRAVISPYASPPSLGPRRLRPAAASAPSTGTQLRKTAPPRQPLNSICGRDRNFNQRVCWRRDVEGGRLPAFQPPTPDLWRWATAASYLSGVINRVLRSKMETIGEIEK